MFIHVPPGSKVRWTCATMTALGQAAKEWQRRELGAFLTQIVARPLLRNVFGKKKETTTNHPKKLKARELMTIFRTPHCSHLSST